MILRCIASAMRRQDWAAVLIELIDYRLAVIRQGEMQFLPDARAQVLQLIERIDAERGGKAEAVPGGAET